ncbi:NmrA family NAD(P)-binding protein [Tsukamurella spumae]|uniref:NmrA family NAD(P)-binding protein n=1 Tax=Tsukamurella spumae TaxID=44753 RepID=A0A846X6E5_9ACTN|nr:NmrA family NAD(P)-binding protein [Tsukamurella spumae]NKY20066.1 NmrA family NAD(P)-binding protein [Tsukamurella spumae]
MASTKTVALVGATGHLGGLIAAELLADPTVHLRILVRADSRAKAAGLEERGAEVVVGDLTDEAALHALVQGATTVISAVQGGPDVVIDGQRRLLAAARAEGVRRFIPSTFSADLFTVPEGAILTGDMRRQFARIADEERGDVEVVHILIGGFLDRTVLFGFIRVIDPQTKTAYVWGDGRFPMDWTTYADTARYTAAVAVDDEPVGPVFAAAGDTLDFQGIVAAYEKGSGSPVTVERLGSLEDLDARIDELRSVPGASMFTYLPLMYYRAQMRGQGRLDPLMNDRYPQIRPTTIEEYVRSEGL